MEPQARVDFQVIILPNDDQPRWENGHTKIAVLLGLGWVIQTSHAVILGSVLVLYYFLTKTS